MLLLQDDLELLLREFGAKDLGELMHKRTSTDKVVKPSIIMEPARRVQLSPSECQKLCDKVGLRYQPGYENRVIERITTTEAPDRYGDIVRAKGIDNVNYRKNPVVLFSHNHGDFPVGKSIKEWQDKAINGWRSWDLYFGDEVDPTGKSDLTFRMVDSGAMPGGSIGFIPGQSKCDHNPEERTAMGLGRFGVEYLTCEKLEHSVCSIPANPEALSNCLKSIEEKRLKSLFSITEIDRMSSNKMLDAQLLDVFASCLGVQRSTSLPSIPVVEPTVPVIIPTVKEERFNVPINMTLNLDLSESQKSIADIHTQVKTFNDNFKTLSESFETRFSELMATTQRALSALEQRQKSSGIYDRKELEDVLRISRK